MMRQAMVMMTVAVTLLAAQQADGFSDIPEWIKQARQVLKDESLKPAEKIAKLDALFPDDVPLSGRAHYLIQADWKVAAERLLAGFRNQKQSMSERLLIARVLLKSGRTTPFEPDPTEPLVLDFGKEYGPWLIEQVLARRQQMLESVEQRTLTPIGELANIANGFQGHDREHFELVKDPRLIPVLIEGLKIPDQVYGGGTGDARRGEPGESTGRNVDRQHIPVALARLGATKAIPALIEVLKTHHDVYLRENAAYALGVLVEPEQRPPLVEYMQARKFDASAGESWSDGRASHLFAFGRGLLEAGDSAGVAYLVPEYSIYHGSRDPSSIRFMLKPRLTHLNEITAPQTAVFAEAVLEDKAVWAMFCFDTDYFELPRNATVAEWLEANEQDIVQMHEQLCNLIERNKLTGMRAKLTDLAEQTPNDKIRIRTTRAINRLDQQ